MFQNIGFTELLLIAVVALVLFGPNKLPEIGRVLGRTIRDFKKGAYELMNDEAPKAAPAPVAVQQAPQASPAGEGEAPAVVAFATNGPALDKAEEASPVSPAPAAAVAYAERFAAMDEADTPPVSPAAPAAVQPAEKAAVSFVSSAPGPDLAEESVTQPAISKPAQAAVQPSNPRRLPD